MRRSATFAVLATMAVLTAGLGLLSFGCGDGMLTFSDTVEHRENLGSNGMPQAPTGLTPDGDKIRASAVTLETDAVGGASSYEFEIEYYRSGAFQTYYTYGSSTHAKRFWPATDDKVYRWRARAKNRNGAGPWSHWARFDFGTPTSRPPSQSGSSSSGGTTSGSGATTGASSGGSTSGGTGSSGGSGTTGGSGSTSGGSGSTSGGSGSTSGGSGSSTVPGAPTGLSPADGKQLYSSSVTLGCDDFQGGSRYEFAIERYDEGTSSWETYYTYSPYGSSQRFWPQYDNTAYRWRVRARDNSGWSPWTNWRVFLYGNATNPGGGSSSGSGSGGSGGSGSSGGSGGSGSCGTSTMPQSYAWPTPQTKWVCQRFRNPIQYQSCGFHTGTDLCGNTGDPILSMADGEVVHVGYMWLKRQGTGRGPYTVIVKHGPNFYSTYGHNSKALVNEGDCVQKGEKIALMGSKGYSSGPHLHLEMVQGTPFTGSWQTPFNNACSYYVDPTDYASP